MKCRGKYKILESIIQLDKKFDVVIIGAGIIGVALSLELAKKTKELAVLVIEKEKAPGLHASGRNSGVVHAGFYYSPESLKAKFCREGNVKLQATCRKLEIPIRKTGKVVVSQNTTQTSALEKLFQRGLENEVEVEIYEDRHLSRFEPLARSSGGFIWSPTTAVSDPKALISKLVSQARDMGVEFSFGSVPRFAGGEIDLDGSRIKYCHLVNSAGAQAIEIAHNFGAGKNYSIMPFLGTYAYLNSGTLPLRTLVYPLPDPVNPFLGVHFTITTDGLIKIGPSAIPIFGGEQYNFSQIPKIKEIMQTMKSAGVMGARHPLSTLSLIHHEFPKMRIATLVKEAGKLVPSARRLKGWKRKPGGIRSQLVNLESGKLEQDFIVEVTQRETHILNAVSPGWTSAIPFAEWICQEYVLPRISTKN